MKPHERIEKKRRWHSVVLVPLALLIFCAGFFAGTVPNPFHAHPDPLDQFSDFPDEREQSHGYQFVSPLLSCGERPFDHLGDDVINELEEKLTAYINGAKNERHATHVSLYFKQLKGGSWLGINHDHDFSPASLLKIPLAIAVYKSAERDPEFLAQEIFFKEGNATESQYFKDELITPGSTYTVDSLVESMLVHSDNNAADLLTQVVTLDQFLHTHTKLGVRIPDSGRDFVSTVREYSSFFRVLYNATYLSSEDSERILELLSRSTFEQGIVAGIPKGVPVAHKFGERTFAELSQRQLHDCGIVYHPVRPYLLCVMTQGPDFDMLLNVVSAVSRIVYTYIETSP